MGEKGIIVACDAQQEWLLSWWWDRYSTYNAFPVAFFDLGMSEEAKAWCKKRGRHIILGLDGSFVKPKERISPQLIREWEAFYGPTLWTSRPNWFRKPFICLQTPFQQTIWFDLDCEILGSIDSIFTSASLAMVREPRFLPDVRYNGGVICFTRGIKILEQWAETALNENERYWGDDPLLSALIAQMQWKVLELDPIYNWRLAQGVNTNAVIHHWVGSAGKAYIKHFGGIKPLLDGLPRGDL